MRKVSAICVVIFIIIFFSGKTIYDNKIEAIGKEAYSSFQEEVKKQKADKQALLASLNPELNENQSIIDYLHYKSLTKNNVVISVIGSSVAAGHGASDPSVSWSGLLEKEIKSFNTDLRKVVLKNNGVGGYSTSNILENNVLETVVENNPDLVIFETSLLNNHGQSITLDDTKEQINEIATILQDKLPDAKILLISPNPATMKPESDLNQLGYSYQDYLNEIKEYAETQNWEYVDIYNGMLTKLDEENIDLNDISEDGIHPNDTGYRIWFEVLFEYISNTP